MVNMISTLLYFDAFVLRSQYHHSGYNFILAGDERN